ncbi:hypothetical protein JP75_18430 [Devosia riboflavina]|uniref:HTH lysR-type domain-containing protein n=1 Tax=Devosia riboflavina TaxID=46914 RepID=A0A087LZ22_9HYPH|nr:LysR family transcriptional regulator [Devosia riboflavina]KFL29875.1 hypothetical protein JP75_18430 [Devosia riboflavina]
MFDTRYHLAMARLRFRQLQLISVLGRTHNLNAAARQLVMTQPAATKMLQEVEDIIGSNLFERLPRGMRPTEAGNLAVEYSHRAIDEAIRFLDDARVLREGGQGVLQVGSIMSAARSVVPTAIAAMKAARPMLTIRLMTGTSDQLVVALLQHRINLVIGQRSETTSYATNFHPLASEALTVFVSPDNPLAFAGGDIERMLDTPWVLQPITSPLRLAMERYFDGIGRHPGNIVETTSVYATIELVRQNGMVSVLANDIVAPEVGSGRIVGLPLEIHSERIQYGIITRADEEVDAITAQFSTILKNLPLTP